MNLSSPPTHRHIRALHRRGFGMICLFDRLAADRAPHPDTWYVLEGADGRLVGDDTQNPRVFQTEWAAMNAAHERGLAATVLRFTLTDLDGAGWTEDLG